MGKVKGKHRLDKYYRLAKERGFRSRASYKLLQLNDKYNFFHSSTTVLDLCAAPGGWMQVAVEKAPVGSFVLGIDLVPISPVRGCVSIQQDITKTNQCKAKIKQVMEKHGRVNETFNLVMHDGSPNVGGAWDQEAMCQNALVIDSLKLATEFLAPRGNFITKVFRSRDYNSVLYCLSKLFDKVEVFKPLASRSQSAETYLLGLRYKAPAKIDPRLLDFRHLFKEAVEPTRKIVNVLDGSKQKRHRSGYEDGESILRKVASAADFIWSENPLDILGTASCISFDDNQASLPLKEHDLTTQEIKILCGDLLVLGKNDLKGILKWRTQIRKALTCEKREGSKNEFEDVGKEDEDDDELLNELDELLSKRHAKSKSGEESPYITPFDLATRRRLKWHEYISGKKDLMAVENDEDGNEEDHDDSSSDEELDSSTEKMEETLDKAYEWYLMLKKQGSSAKQSKRAKHDDKVDEMKLDDFNSVIKEEEKDDDATNPLVEAPLDDAHDGETETTKEEAMEEADPVQIIGHPKALEATEEDDFEIVPTSPDRNTELDSSSNDDKVDTKVEILECTKRMQRNKLRQEMFDYAYNKNTLEDNKEALLLSERFLDVEKKRREDAMKLMKPKRSVDRKKKSIGGRLMKKRKQ